MLNLSQRQIQTQKLTPQQIQYQKLLQLNTLALEQRIKTELELNPILEEILPDDVEISTDENDEEDLLAEDEASLINNDEGFELNELYNQSELDDSGYNTNEEFDKDFMPAKAVTTLREVVLQQLHLLNLNNDEMILGETIIGYLDKDGYFKEDCEKIIEELKLFDHIEFTKEEAESVLKKIQTLDPPGIAARNLKECLLIQLRNGSFDPYYSYIAEKIISDFFDEFANKKYDIIIKEMDLTLHTIKAAVDLIHKLNPKPGEGTIDDEFTNQITPDFIVEKINNNYTITLNDRGMPSVMISQSYLEMIENQKKSKTINEREKETTKFLKEKLDSAKWFISSIEQRRNTLITIMKKIVEKQYKFFDEGIKGIQPLIYKDIAEEVNLDISTISRVVNGKYVQSVQGIHELKYFFSEGLMTDSGEAISNKKTKELIKELIESESKKKPLSDDKIAKLLEAQGIQIARRTITKYREQLNIPVARLRKEL